MSYYVLDGFGAFGAVDFDVTSVSSDWYSGNNTRVTSAAKKIQAALNELGFSAGAVDGMISTGGATQKAWRAFADKFNLSAKVIPGAPKATMDIALATLADQLESVQKGVTPPPGPKPVSVEEKQPGVFIIKPSPTAPSPVGPSPVTPAYVAPGAPPAPVAKAGFSLASLTTGQKVGLGVGALALVVGVIALVATGSKGEKKAGQQEKKPSQKSESSESKAA